MDDLNARMTLVLWIFGTMIGIQVVVIGFIVNWVHKTADAVSDLRADIPARYANEGDIKRVEQAIQEARSDFNTAARELREGLGKVADKLSELVGQERNRDRG